MTPISIKIDKAGLQRTVNAVKPAISGRSSLPILACMLLQLEGGGLNISATNLDLWITSSCPVTLEGLINTAAALAVPAEKLGQIVREMPGKDIELEFDLERKRLNVRSAGASFVIHGHAAAEFPPAPVITGQNLQLVSTDLLGLIDGVRHATSTDESRYVLCGVFFDLRLLAGENREDIFTAVATDGRRLANASLVVNGNGRTDAQMIVPSAAISAMCPLLSADRKVEISWSANHFRLSTGQDVLISKLIDGNYPNWKQVVPARTAAVHMIALDVAPLARALRMARIMTDEKHDSVVLTLNKGHVVVESTSPELGSAREVVPAVASTEGKLQAPAGMEISFAPNYLIEAIQAQPGATLSAYFLDALGPALLVGTNWSAVVMPRRNT